MSVRTLKNVDTKIMFNRLVMTSPDDYTKHWYPGAFRNEKNIVLIR